MTTKREIYLDAKEVMELLKYKSIRTVYKKIKRGEIQVLESIKGSYRIPKSQFDEERVRRST